MQKLKNELTQPEMDQLIPEKIRRAAERAIQINLPFVIYSFPGEKNVRFFASMPRGGENSYDLNDPDGRAFIVTLFASPVESTVGIRDELTADDVLAMGTNTPPFDGPHRLVRPNSTEYGHYLSNFHEAKKGLRYNTKKVVLSRRIAVSVKSEATELAEQYFTLLPETFRALYFTQETGLWLTATPERLLNYEETSGELNSMALAGTRTALTKTSVAWDEKNTHEHDLVVDHILETFSNNGFKAVVSEQSEVCFGDVKHLCHLIKAKGNGNVIGLLDNLNPTPAVAGYPVKKAIELINRYEPHSRECYGGWLGVKDGKNLDIYVNLRSAMIEPADEGRLNMNIICGGGIMKESEPQDEWTEAGQKAAPLWRIIKHLDPKEIGNERNLYNYNPTVVPPEWFSAD